VTTHQRKRCLIDPKVQGAIVGRSVAYWAYCLVTIALLLFFWRVLAGPAAPPHEHLLFVLKHFAPAALASALILPVTIYDALRLSHRFAGPVYRLGMALDELAAGRTVRPLRFRDGDFWHDPADKYNAVAARLDQLKPAAEPESLEEPCRT
jgi:hypothetical protein